MSQGPVLAASYEGEIPEVVVGCVSVDVYDELVPLQRPPNQSTDPGAKLRGVVLSRVFHAMYRRRRPQYTCKIYATK